MRNEYLFGIKARGGNLHDEEEEEEDSTVAEGEEGGRKHATCEACEPLEKRILELEAEVRHFGPPGNAVSRPARPHIQAHQTPRRPTTGATSRVGLRDEDRAAAVDERPGD